MQNRANSSQLQWKDLQLREESEQLTVFGKGGKTRSVLLSAGVFHEICELRGDAIAHDPVFQSREGDKSGQTLDVRFTELSRLQLNAQAFRVRLALIG